MTESAQRPCRACGAGTIRLLARPGRTWHYRRLTLEVPADFAIPTCDACGEEWLDRHKAQALDAALREQYIDRLLGLFRRAIAVLKTSRSQRELERLLGLSQGYLSKVLSGKKVPSEALVAGLVLLAKSPDARLRELETTWGVEPPPWLLGEARAAES